ncbi:hypothetical protein Acr_12g0006270 [Actinidia rufa]|uniref:Uncharacterized protein n=1 Tax=Actinidia rufa TaxID=165716 RepID=A0A7J0FI14_9ERIC|nr:hypothetical protein Acr_12g0006270 [Actinidia rufa]
MSSELVRANTATRSSLRSKPGGGPAPELGREHYWTVDIATVRAKANVTSDLSLYSKLGRITTPRLGRGAMVGDNPKAQQGTEGDLHGKTSSDSPHVWIEMSAT